MADDAVVPVWNWKDRICWALEPGCAENLASTLLRERRRKRAKQPTILEPRQSLAVRGF